MLKHNASIAVYLAFRRIYFRLLSMNLWSRDNSVTVVIKPRNGQKTNRVWSPAVFSSGNKSGNYCHHPQERRRRWLDSSGISHHVLIDKLRPQSPCHSARQPPASVSHNLQPSYLSHMTAAATYADQYWHIHRSDCTDTLIYVHTTSRVLPACDICIWLQKFLFLKLETLWN